MLLLRAARRRLTAAGAISAEGKYSLRLFASQPQEAEDKPEWALEVDSLNPRVLDAKYAVRGDIVLRAMKIQEELEKGTGNYPFKKLIYCNIGNPQALGQPPMTFIRQVEVLTHYPALLDMPEVRKTFPADAVERARLYLSGLNSTGAYTDSRGAAGLRKLVAKGIERRDGYPADPNTIFLTDGATPCVHHTFKMLIRDRNDCILTPVPQYPLYSASIEMCNGTLLPYYLDEGKGWALNVEELRSQVESANSQGKVVRGLVVINPGNPTGQILSEDNMREIVDFCRDTGIVLFADEVYQENIYKPGASFTSFKKIVCDMGLQGKIPLVSMMSASKGFYGECGKRGGYMEVLGVAPGIYEQLYKMASINLSPNTSGQMAMATVMNPPQPGDPSYDLWVKEREAVQASFKRRADRIVDALNQMEDVSCNSADGAMYIFPRVEFPERFLASCKKAGKAPELTYCMDMLEQTGIVSVPGNGFGQEPGTHHFRLTFLPPEDQVELVTGKIADFHARFMAQWK